MSDEPTPGGVSWELSEAIRLMGEAVASGDGVAIATAMRRHAEALSNQAYHTLVPTLEKVLATVVKSEIGQVTSAITNTITVQDQRFGYILNQIGAFIEKEDTRHDNYSGELTAIVDGLGGLRADVQQSAVEFSARLKKHEQDIEILMSVQNEHGSRLDQLDSMEEWRTGVDTRLSAIEKADRDDIRTEIKNTNSEIASMKTMLKQYDSELRELVDRLAARGGNHGQ